MATLKLSLAAGYVLMFYSELVFWSRVDPKFKTVGSWLGDHGPMYLLYSSYAFLLLSLVRIFRVKDPRAMFLAGAVFGWLLEGVAVPTMYQYFPKQVAWTGLAWHAPLDALIGMYLIPRALGEGSPARIAGIAVAVGFFWGFWADAWRQDRIFIPSASFVPYAFITTLPLLAAYRAFHFGNGEAFRPNKWMLILSGLLLVYVFAVAVVPAYPFAPLVLLPLLGLTLFGLNLNRRKSAPDDYIVHLPEKQGILPLLSLLLMPSTASLTHAFFRWLSLPIQGLQLVFILSSVLAVVLYLLCLLKVMTSPGTKISTNSAAPLPPV